ncbi:MAG: hypothetical protein JWN56_1869 [Sphingobacteriales bacterium]|nr:hypothetical protein [Sphingobacteriales bacterium]
MNQNQTNENNQQIFSADDLTDNNPVTIPVIEERLSIGKEKIETGKVVFTKKVHSEPVTVDIPIVEDEVDVERISINRFVESTPEAIRQEGDKTIISVLKEVLVVEKKLVLVEELHITKRQKNTTEHKEETLKKEEIIVNRLNPDQSSNQ